MSGEVNSVASACILRCVRETARRFENSSGGGKEWRATLTEIISHLPGDRWPSSFDINRKLSDDLTGIRSFILDDGGDIDESRVTGLGLVGSSEFALLSSTGVYHWVIGPPTNMRVCHVIHSRQCAWFIEQLRQLGFTGAVGDREGFARCEMTWRTLISFLQFTLEQSNWTTELRPPHLPALTFVEKLDRCFMRISGHERLGQNATASLHDLFNQEQRESTQAQPLSLALGDLSPALHLQEEEAEVAADEAVPLSRAAARHRVGIWVDPDEEEDLLPGQAEWRGIRDTGSPEQEAGRASNLNIIGTRTRSLTERVAEQERAEQEQERVEQERAELHRVGIWVESDGEGVSFRAERWWARQTSAVNSEEEAVSPSLAEVDATLKKEKTQLVEILGILGEKVEEDELGEGAYKEYADLLMKFHKILGEESQRVVNV
jgi:hypothetical protein